MLHVPLLLMQARTQGLVPAPSTTSKSQSQNPLPATYFLVCANANAAQPIATDAGPNTRTGTCTQYYLELVYMRMAGRGRGTHSLYKTQT